MGGKNNNNNSNNNNNNDMKIELKLDLETLRRDLQALFDIQSMTLNWPQTLNNQRQRSYGDKYTEKDRDRVARRQTETDSETESRR